MASVASTNGQSSVRMIELDDFDPRDMDDIGQKIQGALTDLGYENVTSFSWSVRVWFEPNSQEEAA